MCTMIVHQAKIDGRGKGTSGWFEVIEEARNLVKTIEAVLAQAEERGVLEDIPLAAAGASR